MKLEQAKVVAKFWVDMLTPYCERIEIAGGVRRQKPEPHDIEIICVPKTEKQFDMFGNVIGNENALQFFLDGCSYFDLCKLLKNGPKYKQIGLPEGINLDLFIVRSETWAVQFVIRTGPAEFSHRIVTPRKYGGLLPSDCNVKDGQVWRHGKALEFSEETEFLDFLELGWIEPQNRLAVTA
jgi:DNA polymerase/3'-5' exonuclease PolX